MALQLTAGRAPRLAAVGPHSHSHSHRHHHHSRQAAIHPSAGAASTPAPASASASAVLPLTTRHAAASRPCSGRAQYGSSRTSLPHRTTAVTVAASAVRPRRPRSAALGRRVALGGGGGGGGAAPLRPRRAGRSAVGVAVEANLFSRVYRIVTSFFNGLVSSFEDPERLLDRVAEEMQEDMIRMRQATAQVMASQKQLSAKQRSMQDAADQWLKRAELAVGRGQDDLAREALRRRKVLQEDADRMGEQVTLQSQALEQLQANVRMLEGKLGEARSKKETLKARAASAKTSIALQEMIGGLQIRSGSSWAAFEKMEEKVGQLEAQAQSAAALAAPDSLERQFAALEGSAGVDAELAELKRQRRAGPPPVLPPPPPPPLAGVPLRDVFDPLERELEELRRRSRE